MFINKLTIDQTKDDARFEYDSGFIACSVGISSPGGLPIPPFRGTTPLKIFPATKRPCGIKPAGFFFNLLFYRKEF